MGKALAGEELLFLGGKDKRLARVFVVQGDVLEVWYAGDLGCVGIAHRLSVLDGQLTCNLTPYNAKSFGWELAGRLAG